MKYVLPIFLSLCFSSISLAFEMPDLIGTYAIKTKLSEQGPSSTGTATLTITNISATDLVVAIKEGEGFLSFFKVIYVPERNIFEDQRYLAGVAHTGFTPYPDYSMDFSVDPSTHTIKGYYEDGLGNDINFEGPRIQQYSIDTSLSGSSSFNPEIYDGVYDGKSSTRGTSYGLRLIVRTAGQKITSSLIFNQSTTRMETHFAAHATNGTLVLTSGEYPDRSWVQFRLLPIADSRDLSLEYVIGGVGAIFSNVVMKKIR